MNTQGFLPFEDPNLHFINVKPEVVEQKCRRLVFFVVPRAYDGKGEVLGIRGI
jgi:hypothetical protein